MIIKKDNIFASEIKQRLYAFIKSKRRKEDGKYHVSDLLYPRFAVLSKTFGYEPTDREIGFFANGIAWHEFIQKILGIEHAEQSKEYQKIIGTADYMDDSVLVEIKTSRKWTVLEELTPEYIQQLLAYCVIHGRMGGKIMVVFPTAGRKLGKQASEVEIVAWDIHFSSETIETAKSE